jgi:hypothetical protein
VTRTVPFALFALALAGCPAPKPPPPPPTCDDTFVGDPSLPPEAIIVVTDGLSSALTDVNDGDMVPLMPPPQGGEVTYAAARVRNVNRCAVQFRGRFRDPTTNEELAFDGRNIDLVVGADGWARPDATQVSDLTNIPLCPDYDPMRDNVGATLKLEINIADQKGHSTTVSKLVVPTCGASLDPTLQAQCDCICRHVPHTCSTDGGL